MLQIKKNKSHPFTLKTRLKNTTHLLLSGRFNIHSTLQN